MKKAKPYPARVLAGQRSQRTFSGSQALQVAMPLGGIGAGCICLNGQGGLQDFSIYHRPHLTALPDGHTDTPAAFALLHVKGRAPVTRLVEGPMPPERIYDQGLKGQGYRGGGHEGLPRFLRATFKGEFPFAAVSLADPDVPLRVTVTGFSPFIPLDDKDSSLPCAILEYTLRNPTRRRVDYEFSYHLSHLAAAGSGCETRSAVIPGAGVFLYNDLHPHDERFGSASLTVVGRRPAIKAMWFRGGWFDSVSVLWREVSTGTFTANRGSPEGGPDGRNGGSILLAGSLGPGREVTYPIVIAWHFLNSRIAAGGIETGGQGQPAGRADEPPAPKWRPYYASQWKDARDVAAYVRRNYRSLRTRTQAFHDALFGSTLPSYVLDAVASNLAILKSPTVLRLENGDVWGWEGCFSGSGCCHGSCTHVWNYAQALPHLFPALERTLRERELVWSMDERGHVDFRSALPAGPTPHTFHAASDGQLGGVMKVYRDWQISGDRAWVARMYPLVKRSMDYAIATWDPRCEGVLSEPHHNTYDIEFWGPDGMCSSIYLGALAAMAELARDAGHAADAARYLDLAAKGARHLDERLFNGEYYEQKVTWECLRDTSFRDRMAALGDCAGEEERLLKAEGPKYQYGAGCLSDGVIGAWMARLYGITTPQTRANVRKNLRAIFEYNFRPSLRRHANTQRPGYAMGDEPGLLLCSWPRGGKPTLPFPYSDEVWTGIEYQVASHLIEEDLVAEGLTLVHAARRRYDGRTRNPFNEYECGNFYARAMSSYALLGSLAGFRYSAASRTLWFGPKLGGRRFRTFFSTATGFGTIALSGGRLAIELLEGTLAVDTLVLAHGGRTQTIPCRVAARAGRKAVIRI